MWVSSSISTFAFSRTASNAWFFDFFLSVSSLCSLCLCGSNFCLTGGIMAVRVHIPTPLREHTNKQAVLNDVGRQFPGVTQRLFDNGQVRRFVNVYLNDEDIRYLDSLATPVKDGDELAIIPAVAGG